MRTLKFYGASDDLCEIEGTVTGEPNEFGPGRFRHGSNAALSALADRALHVRAGGGRDSAGIIVTWLYTAAGTWSIGVASFNPKMAGTPPDWADAMGPQGLLHRAP